MSDTPNNRGLNTFLNRFGWFSGLVALVGIAVPSVLIDSIKPEAGTGALNSLFFSVTSIITVVSVYLKCHRMARYRLQNRLIFSAIITGLTATVYLLLLSWLTEKDVLGNRYVKGYQYTPAIIDYKLLVKTARERGETVDEIVSDRELVINYQNDPANVWTHSSITQVAFLLHTLFTILAVPASAIIAFFLLTITEQKRSKEENGATSVVQRD